jgi:hypothetical protein
MIFWKDIPVAVKLGIGGVMTCMALVGYLSTYQTDVEAQNYQQYNNKQVALFRVQQAEEQILSGDLTAAQREWILAEIHRLEVQIACIRNGTC